MAHGDPLTRGAHTSSEQILDLRDDLEREAEPATLYFDTPTLPVSLEAIERGDPLPLDRARPVLVVCAAGLQSKLAALYLEADGYRARSLEGGLMRLRSSETRLRLEGVRSVPAGLPRHPWVRMLRFEDGVLEVWGRLSEAELLGMLETPPTRPVNVHG
ncbi:rhodanese-related sulfurtransferase [Deinobacterium chartae]|uniref:Rhodanese-related sulfurtransferase n=1 Tax=Deinobacterium chartae TaxID=521158 RepID=A0A841HWN2_9DEIO|nr:rhodanese-like domain-containing protein [Deinobacterium chartae]MBB6097054.1 rhodanese-related sulfurtransferase [Deinobacterium chartae]